MKPWHRKLSKAKTRLAKHDPRGALQFLEMALDECPIYNKRDIANILLYMGASLRKLGHTDGALQSWSVAAKLKKYGYGQKMADRHVNDYGMVKTFCSEQDDLEAFRSFQLSRYMEAKTICRMGSKAEEDMIDELITDAWIDLKESGQLAGLCSQGKMRLFKETLVIFPFMECPEEFTYSDNVISMDFVKKERIKPESKCSCGSRRDFLTCCGRTRSVESVKNGSF